jgi:uncharacterized protein
MQRFSWDDEKAAANLKDHGVSFEAASTVFDDPFYLTAENLEFEGEQRYDAVGAGTFGLVLHVTFIDWLNGIEVVTRIISARKATPRERRAYEHYRK